MKLKILATVAAFSCGVALAADKVHWSYEGEAGPAHWGQLDPAYEACGLGVNQSPINIENTIEADLAPLQLNYQAGGTEVVNNGHTIQVNYVAGSTLQVEGREFELKQFHFHTPSENTINQRSFPMEVHLVHADKSGNLAVIGIMMNLGDDNSAVAAAMELAPETEGKMAVDGAIDVRHLLPQQQDYFRFNGSLTTPPCSEGVIWLVMKHPISVKKEDMEKLSRLVHGHNARPVQPINARPILQ